MTFISVSAVAALRTDDDSALLLNTRVRDKIFKLLSIKPFEEVSINIETESDDDESESETTLHPDKDTSTYESSDAGKADVERIADAIDAGANDISDRSLQHLLFDADVTSRIAAEVAASLDDDVIAVVVATEGGVTRVMPARLFNDFQHAMVRPASHFSMFLVFAALHRHSLMTSPKPPTLAFTDVLCSRMASGLSPVT